MHIPVLKNEVVKLFTNIKNGYFLDATLGYAGHSSAILESNKALNLIACDQDDEAIEYSQNKLKTFNRNIKIIKTNYENILKIIEEKEQIRGVLADIGVSSLQLDKDERGFSFNSKELDMRMNTRNKFSAKNIVNEYSLNDLSNILEKYAELNPKLSSDIAKKIISNRPINSCQKLSQIIGNSKLNSRNVTLKTLVFQAIRIEVNNELGVLENFLNDVSKLKDCLVCIITFHSLEDKIVKNTFKKWANSCICDNYAVKCECGNNHSIGKIITKKPITPSKEEISLNSRASCAKLRAFYIENR